jgi:hypothetical protein
MSRLLMLATIQAAAYGPVAPSPKSQSLENAPSVRGCAQISPNEIVVCRKAGPTLNQMSPTLSQPSSGQRLSLDPDGLFRLKLGKGMELGGGGPKSSAGASLRIHF